MRKKKILVIDDDEMNLQIAEMVLEKKLACEVFSVDSGEAGIEFLRRERVDLVLLDIVMPERDGLETLAEIRSDARIKDVPVIMLTASSAAENIQRSACRIILRSRSCQRIWSRGFRKSSTNCVPKKFCW